MKKMVPQHDIHRTSVIEVGGGLFLC